MIMKQKKEHWSEVLARHGACNEALEYCRQFSSMRKAWLALPDCRDVESYARKDWILWVFDILGGRERRTYSAWLGLRYATGWSGYAWGPRLRTCGKATTIQRFLDLLPVPRPSDFAGDGPAWVAEEWTHGNHECMFS
jgi:hypothetical protein